MSKAKIVNSNELPDILSPQQAANYLGISRGRIYEFCQLTPKAGGLPSFTIGKSRKIKKAALLEWIAKQESSQHCV